MSEDGGVRGVVVAHGSMAQGLVDAVRCIAGSAADALQPVSNEGTNPAQLKALIDDVAGSGPVLIFADLQAGSCGMAAMSMSHGDGNRAAVCGVNLPVLLDFVFHRDMPLDALVERLLEKGRDGIRPVPQGA